MKNYFSLRHNPKYSLPVVIVIAGILALGGIYLVFKSHAATNNADFNNDGTVNITDLSILATHWNQTGLTQAQGDANGDGTVNITDLSILATQWGTNPGGGTTASCPTGWPVGYPCAANTGVPAGTSLIHLTDCSGNPAPCPAGVTYSSGFNVFNCGVTIDGYELDSDNGLSLWAGNGNTDTDPTHACLTIKNSKIDGGVAEPGSSGSCGALGVVPQCGPLWIIDSEINYDRTGITDGTHGAFYGVNIHALRLNVHGSDNALFDCPRYCSAQDSYLHNNQWHEATHMAALHNAGDSGTYIKLIHNWIGCSPYVNQSLYDGSGGCSDDVSFFDEGSAVDNITMDSNFLNYGNPAGGPATCVTFPLDGTTLGTASNLDIKNNVYDNNCRGVNQTPPGLTAKGAAIAWDPAWATTHNDRWCNNTFVDGGLVNSAWETGGCP